MFEDLKRCSNSGVLARFSGHYRISVAEHVIATTTLDCTLGHTHFALILCELLNETAAFLTIMIKMLGRPSWAIVFLERVEIL